VVELLEKMISSYINSAPRHSIVYDYGFVNGLREAKKAAAQQSVHLTAFRRGLAASILINVILLAMLLFQSGGK
jgi:hypothetical protein